MANGQDEKNIAKKTNKIKTSCYFLVSPLCNNIGSALKKNKTKKNIIFNNFYAYKHIRAEYHLPKRIATYYDTAILYCHIVLHVDLVRHWFLIRHILVSPKWFQIKLFAMVFITLKESGMLSAILLCTCVKLDWFSDINCLSKLCW